MILVDLRKTSVDVSHCISVEKSLSQTHNCLVVSRSTEIQNVP